MPRTASALFLHGHADTPERLGDVASALTARTGIRPAVPAGPLEVGDHAGRAWWGADEDGPDVRTLDRLRADHGDIDVVLGHSQGAAVALTLGIGRRLVVIAGFLCGAPPRFDHTPDVLVLHGEADDVVDPVHARMIERRARAAGCATTMHLHEGGHALDARTVATALDWLEG
ncbi:MAG: hypothetical protein FJW83_06330 [Actinobacteria bacterium]|nr:hypothetical protein [Actinomycetota bacterium]